MVAYSVVRPVSPLKKTEWRGRDDQVDGRQRAQRYRRRLQALRAGQLRGRRSLLN
jgi:hypothetical protein